MESMCIICQATSSRGWVCEGCYSDELEEQERQTVVIQTFLEYWQRYQLQPSKYKAEYLQALKELKYEAGEDWATMDDGKIKVLK